MSASNHAPVSRALALADRLKTAAEAFAAREDQLERRHRADVFAAQRRHEAALEITREKYLSLRQQTGTAHAQARRRAVEAFNHREQRLARARAHAERALTLRVEKERGAKLLGLQHDELQAERRLQHRKEELATLRADLRAEAAESRRLAARARGGFFGLWQLGRLFGGRHDQALPNPLVEATATAATLRRHAADALQEATREWQAFRRGNLLPRLLGALTSPWLTLAWSVVLTAGVVYRQDVPTSTLPLPDHWLMAGLWWLAAAVPQVVVNFLLTRHLDAAARLIATPLKKARVFQHAALEATVREEAALQQEHVVRDEQHAETSATWETTQTTAAQALEQGIRRLQEKWLRGAARSEARHTRTMRELDASQPQTLRRLQEEGDAAWAQLNEEATAEKARLEQDYAENWDRLAAEWRDIVTPLWQEIERHQTAATAWFPPWSPAVLEQARPLAGAATATLLGRLEIEPAAFADALSKDPRLALPSPATFPLPLTLTFPGEGTLLLETAATGRDAALGALNALVFRLLATVPPRMLNFTLIDPVGLGSSFAGLTHLADYEGGLVSSRVWTRREQIEQRLGELNEHVEKVIQMYLRDEHETIAEYNEAAGNIAERSHFVVIADFPSGFSEAALKQLHNLATTGPRCGVHLFIHWDTRLDTPSLPVFDDLRARGVRLLATPEGGFVFAPNAGALAGPVPGARLTLEAPPEGDAATAFIHRIGRASRDASRVEVPFEHVAPADDALWTETTTGEIRVPLGRTGASKLQYLALGKGTRQHALLAGKTGSGKSNLFHVIVTNLALRCSPAEIEFYLVDFKKGVEFQCYAKHHLPHARVVAIESDREFGLSVLQRLDEELRHRGELFRRAGVPDLAGWRQAGGAPLPRTLLAIDEFQEFFTEDDRVAQTASVLLDRLVRQGRAFGLHVLLGSQTLGGAYSLARATLGQMVVRLALQCNEADALLIMDDGNSAARLLSRPGEGIYNDAAGALEANSPFQAVYLPEDVRDEALEKIAAHAALHPTPGFGPPVVFEGNLPADIRENTALHALLHAPPVPGTLPLEARLWLGAPNAIKGPTEAVLRRQSGSHLLIVGQSDEAILTLFTVSLVALLAQFPTRETESLATAARFLLAEATAPGTPERAAFETLAHTLPHVEVTRGGDVPALIADLTAELARRAAANLTDAPPVFLFLHHLARHKKLRYDDELAYASDAENHPALQFDHLLKEGAAHGIHVLASVDTVGNLTRFVSRKALGEFEMRVLFQMSANDSATLVDTPAAGSLGLHRALFHHEHEGYQEIFRPYGPPPVGWLEDAAYRLRHPAAPLP